MELTARQRAGKQNWLKRRPWSAEDRQRQRENCLRQQPWRHSTGPRTAEGKSHSRLNGMRHLANPQSLRQRRQAITLDVNGLIAMLAEMRNGLG